MTISIRLSVCFVGLLTVLLHAQAPGRSADLVLRNGKIVTVDETRPAAEALAVGGDTIVAIGPNDEIQRHVGPATRVIDLKGALAIPGLIDAHAHFTGVGEAARNLKLGTAKNWDDIVRMVGDAAKRSEERRVGKEERYRCDAT